jgi:hypothetical protein
MTISTSSNLVLKTCILDIEHIGTVCPSASRSAAHLLKHLKTECSTGKLAWQVYSMTKKLAKKKGLIKA